MCSLLAKAAQPLLLPESGGTRWMTVARQARASFAEEMERFRRTGDAGRFYDAMDAVLFDGHTRSHLSGQDRAGGLLRAGLARTWGRQVSDDEVYWLRGFVDRLESGFYIRDGEFDEAWAKRHWDLYVGKMRGSASRGFLDGSMIDDRFQWRISGVEDHCSECPTYASYEPMPASEWPTQPGMGDTPCIGNCKCHFVRLRDGLSSEPAP